MERSLKMMVEVNCNWCESEKAGLEYSQDGVAGRTGSQGSQTRLHAASLCQVALDQSSPSPPHFCRIRKALAGSLAEDVHHYLKKQSSCRQKERLCSMSLDIFDTSHQTQSHAPASMLRNHALSTDLHFAAYRLVLPPDTRSRQKQ